MKLRKDLCPHQMQIQGLELSAKFVMGLGSLRLCGGCAGYNPD
jgi:hypothetical protein